MPFVETRFISPTALTTSASSALYTVPTGYSAIIKQLVVTNTTGTAATFTFYIGAASAGNALFSGTSVAANDTVIINLSQVLATGETLRALASTGSALNLTVSGVLNDGPLASTATYIPDGAITTAKIADSAVITADIANTAVTSAKLADSLALTGTPTAPTASAGTNTTQIATMASKPWNVAWGMQTYTTATANDLTITGEELQITGSSFTAVTGRLYRITYYEPELYGSTSYMQVNIRNTNISGAIRQLHYVQLNGNNNVPSHLIWIGTLTAGATNFVATLSSYSGTGAAYRAANQVAYLAVEDIGPA